MAVQEFYFFGSYNAFRPFKIKVFSGADSKFTIPTSGTGYNYRAKVAGVVDVSGLTGNYTINFPSANTDYVIEIYGLFPQWRQSNNAERLKAKDVMQCGDIVWRSFNYAFYGCSNMAWSATDIPNTSNVDNFDSAFRDTLVNVNVNSWDWSNAKTIFGFFWNGIWDNNGLKLDISIPKVGSNNTSDTNFLFFSSPIKEVILRDINYDINLNSTSLYCLSMTLLELHGCFSNVDIRSTALTGIGIDNLANSVKDMTGLASPSITMKLAQRASCNQALWTNKNWTIIAI